MLVLSRKNHQSVVVGDAESFGQMLKVTVLDARRGKVRLGFEIGADVPVHRWEVWQRLTASQQEHATARR